MVLIQAPVRQVIVLSVYGVLLAVLFLAFQAPDVTLSELTVGAVRCPSLLLLTLAKVGGGRNDARAPAPLDLPGRGGRPGRFYLWGLAGLPGFGHYPGPYGDIINRIAVAQTNATGVVSAVNFEYRGFDTLGEEFILFAAAAGMATVLRHLRGERERTRTRRDGADRVTRRPPATRCAWPRCCSPARSWSMGWFLASHAQTSPSGGFQGGVVLATAFILIYLAGEFLLFRRVSPADLTDAVEAVGAGGFAAVGVAAVAMGLPYLSNYLPLGSMPGAVSSSGTIALISFFVGLEVAAAFLLIVERAARPDAARPAGGPVMELLPVRGRGLDPGRRACTASSPAATWCTRSSA